MYTPRDASNWPAVFSQTAELSETIFFQNVLINKNTQAELGCFYVKECMSRILDEQSKTEREIKIIKQEFRVLCV